VTFNEVIRDLAGFVVIDIGASWQRQKVWLNLWFNGEIKGKFKT